MILLSLFIVVNKKDGDKLVPSHDGTTKSKETSALNAKRSRTKKQYADFITDDKENLEDNPCKNYLTMLTNF